MKNRTSVSSGYVVSFLALLFFYDLALNVTSTFLNATTLIPTSQEKAETNKASLLRGTEILLKAVEASGGLENFQAIKNFRIKTQNKLSLSQKDMQLTVTETVMLPDKTKQVFEMPEGKRVQVLNGETGWLQIGPTMRDLALTEKREMKRGLFRDTINLFQRIKSEELKIQYFGDETLGGKTFHVLHISNKAGDFFNINIDAETFLIAKKIYHGSSEVGLATLEEIYSDYREVDGIKLPFHTVVRANGKKFIDSVVIEAKLNIEIEEGFFSKN
jgi:hypothetical protein